MEPAEKLTFEKAGPEDIEVICGLCKELIDRYENVDRIPYGDVLNWVRRKIQTQIHRYTAVWCEGRKVGYFRFCPEGNAMELDDLYVLEPFRNRGIGTAILKRCCESTGLPVFLYVFQKNIRAVELYRRFGFTVTREVDGTRYIMVREGKDERNG